MKDDPLEVDADGGASDVGDADDRTADDGTADDGAFDDATVDATEVPEETGTEVFTVPVGELPAENPLIAGVERPVHVAPGVRGIGLQPGKAVRGPIMFSSTILGVLHAPALVLLMEATNGGHCSTFPKRLPVH